MVFPGPRCTGAEAVTRAPWTSSITSILTPVRQIDSRSRSHPAPTLVQAARRIIGPKGPDAFPPDYFPFTRASAELDVSDPLRRAGPCRAASFGLFAAGPAGSRSWAPAWCHPAVFKRWATTPTASPFALGAGSDGAARVPMAALTPPGRAHFLEKTSFPGAILVTRFVPGSRVGSTSPTPRILRAADPRAGFPPRLRSGAHGSSTTPSVVVGLCTRRAGAPYSDRASHVHCRLRHGVPVSARSFRSSKLSLPLTKSASCPLSSLASRAS